MAEEPVARWTSFGTALDRGARPWSMCQKLESHSGFGKEISLKLRPQEVEARHPNSMYSPHPHKSCCSLSPVEAGADKDALPPGRLWPSAWLGRGTNGSSAIGSWKSEWTSWTRNLVALFHPSRRGRTRMHCALVGSGLQRG